MVILDPEFGSRLSELPANQAVWIVMTTANEPAVRMRWRAAPTGDHLSGVTAFTCKEGFEPEREFLAQLWTIDLHHGPYSSDPPFTVLEVVGCRLSETIRAALGAVGFEEFDVSLEGFTARRSLARARQGG